MKTPKPNPYYRALLDFMAVQEAAVHIDTVAAALGVQAKTVSRWLLDLSDRNLVRMTSDGRFMLFIPDRAVFDRAVADPAYGTLWGFSRQEIYERDGWKCTYCGRPLIPGNGSGHPDGATLDHIVPRSQGGWDNLENLTTACKNCNARKGKRDAGVMRDGPETPP